MSNLDFNSQMYNITAENELAIVLSHYSSEYVFSVIKNALEKRFSSVPIIGIPNVVGAWEQNFKAITINYGNSIEIQKVRNETYQEIIDIICKEFNLNFTVADIDVFSAAYQLYDLFVCKFIDTLIVDFFAKYIYKERSGIYETMGLSEMKKNKNSSTLYYKRIYKDSKIGIINAYIDSVITNICGMDISLYQMISMAIPSKELAQFYIDIISPNGDFFKESIVPILNSEIRAVIITNIRLKLHAIAEAHDQIYNTNYLNNAEENNNTEEEI